MLLALNGVLLELIFCQLYAYYCNDLQALTVLQLQVKKDIPFWYKDSKLSPESDLCYQRVMPRHQFTHSYHLVWLLSCPALWSSQHCIENPDKNWELGTYNTHPGFSSLVTEHHSLILNTLPYCAFGTRGPYRSLWLLNSVNSVKFFFMYWGKYLSM